MELPEKAEVSGIAMPVGFCSRCDSTLDDENPATTGSARRAVCIADCLASTRKADAAIWVDGRRDGFMERNQYHASSHSVASVCFVAGHFRGLPHLQPGLQHGPGGPLAKHLARRLRLRIRGPLQQPYSLGQTRAARRARFSNRGDSRSAGQGIAEAWPGVSRSLAISERGARAPVRSQGAYAPRSERPFGLTFDMSSTPECRIA